MISQSQQHYRSSNPKMASKRFLRKIRLSQLMTQYIEGLMELQIPKDRYFLQLIPIHLNRISKKAKPKSTQKSEIKFALFLQSHKVAQTKQWMQLQFVKNTFKCKNSSLDFYITNFNSDFYTNFTLKVIVREPPMLKYIGDSQDQICGVEEVINQLGFFQLDPGVYIQTFNDDRKALFQQNIEISNEYSLDYELYIERTRFRLEKVIRQARGINNEANLLALAFKKHTGKKKIRYVEFDESRERSVKEEDFKKTKKTLISSLKKNGKKYIPQKTVEPDSNSSRNMTPIKIMKGIQTKANSYLCSQNSPFLKVNPRILQLNKINQASKEQSNVQPAKITRQALTDRTFINPHSSFDTSLIANRLSFDRCLQKALLAIFWLVALFLLYLSMGPSRKI